MDEKELSVEELARGWWEHDRLISGSREEQKRLEEQPFDTVVICWEEMDRRVRKAISAHSMGLSRLSMPHRRMLT